MQGDSWDGPTPVQVEFEAHQQMLSALSLEHRNLLSQVIAQLAGARPPDFRAACAKLDAVLSDAENEAILAANRRAIEQHEAFKKWVQRPRPGVNTNVIDVSSVHEYDLDPSALLITSSIRELIHTVNRVKYQPEKEERA